MFGLILLVATALVSGWVATQIWQSPEWPRLLLLFVAALDVIAVGVVLVRQRWSRRLTTILMGVQLIGVVAVLLVAAGVLVRDNDLGAALTLIPVFFVLPALVNSAIALLVARSIGKWAWLER